MRLELRDLQALTQTSRGVRSLTRAAPEYVWRQAGEKATTRHHPMLSSGSVLGYLQQRGRVQASVASPGSWQLSEPRATGACGILSPDLRLLAKPHGHRSVSYRFNESLSGLLLEQLHVCAQHLFVLTPKAALQEDYDRLALVECIAFSPDSLHVSCLQMFWTGRKVLQSLCVHMCHVADKSITTWSPDYCSPLFLPPEKCWLRYHVSWAPDSRKIALLVGLPSLDGGSARDLVVLTTTGDPFCTWLWDHQAMCMQCAHLEMLQATSSSAAALRRASGTSTGAPASAMSSAGIP